VTGNGGVVEAVDPNALGAASRFYRIKRLSPAGAPYWQFCQ
jgi:hypothetical protein